MLSFFPRDVLDEIWVLIDSVSEGFLTYSSYRRILSVAHYPKCQTLSFNEVSELVITTFLN